MAVGQQWGESALGGTLTSETFSRTYRDQAQLDYIWQQLTRVELALGSGNGDYYTFTKGDDLQDLGQVIGEFDPVPETQYESRKGRVEVRERTMANPYTQRLSLLAKLSVEDINVRKLKNNMAKTLDLMCSDSFRDSDIVYVPTGTGSAPTRSYFFNGDPNITAGRELGYHDVKNLVDDARSRFVMPTWEFGGYILACSVTAARTIKDDNELVENFRYAAPDRLLKGEIGVVYGNTRIIEDLHILENDMSNGCGEAILIAWDAVVEAVAYAEEMQCATYDKWGRHKALRWVTFKGWERVYRHSEDNGQDRTIRVAEQDMVFTA